jgi:Arc/MetJ-type ribon-helix-helix transcriptional regulator
MFSDKTEQALQEIIYYLETQIPPLGEYVNQSDAIRYAVELAAINIRQEREANE